MCIDQGKSEHPGIDQSAKRATGNGPTFAQRLAVTCSQFDPGPQPGSPRRPLLCQASMTLIAAAIALNVAVSSIASCFEGINEKLISVLLDA